MRGVEIVTKVTIVTEECCRCGMVFGVPANMQERYRNTHETFYCPAGHGQSYSGPSEAEQLRKQLEIAEQNNRTLTARVRFEVDQREGAERNLKATKRELTRTKKRVSNGVCPCCNRSFAQLARHMQTKHPDYAGG